MNRFWLLIFGLPFVAAATIDLKDEPLDWPGTYHFEAVRMSISAGNVQDYSVWKTNHSSRVDYNKGAVKSIIVDENEKYRYGVSYEIHPETDDGEDPIFKCNVLLGSEDNMFDLKVILPETDNFEYVGPDSQTVENTIKFVAEDSDLETKTIKTIWATYDEKNNNWHPVRYEVKNYNELLGLLEKHEIWDYFNFNTGFDKSAFDVSQYDCDDENVEEHTLQSETVTKFLMFMDPENDKHVNHVFNSFKNKFVRNYVDNNEHETRRNIFRKNMRLITETNRQKLGYTLGVTQFADRTPEEMQRHKGLRTRPEGKVGNIPFPYPEHKIRDMAEDLPSEYDLRILGYVSKVKNQEDCGSCWTFGTTAAAEGALARINGGRLLSLSNQAILDCAWPYGGSGCEGGSDNAAYDWMMKFGLPTEEEYGSYTNADGICNIKNMSTIYPIRGWTDVTPLNVEALKVAAVNHGPLSVSIDATDKFSLYTGGIFYDTTCTTKRLNHEMALVGYGERDGDTYWIIKNSWGPDWGVEGYLLISSRNNNCGIATEPTYVVY
ncbi:digestive cysteine proteinase 2-like [Bombyx mandarina]|uniref:Digestive cysteine proteinase 2-like n=1 Tax=Bombyx mandarina TaxID=7092 RepID=A0A6J2JM86_BOMMA|nr:digestive cysteine proteinase 2-like [Bombyx mandarina]